MDWVDILKLITVILTIGGTAYAAVHFVLSERHKQTRLAAEIEQLQRQLEVLSTTLREDVNRYQSLQEISSSAQTAIGADLHSISIPVPQPNPTHLKFIVSTDQHAERIIGKEMPINKGLAGKVYQSRRAEFVNRAADDPNHFKVVDQAAGTHTGEGSILSYPLVASGACCGIIQFMKNPGATPFTKEDLTIINRFAERIASELARVEQAAHGDPRLGSVPEAFVSVLFTDINDYSQIARQVSLYQTVSLLDEYYSRMLEVALPCGAAFEEYLGDGVYLSFHGRTKNETVIAAITCARQMQSTFEKLKQEWQAYQYPVSNHNYHNIGIASGNVFEGTIGHSQHRKRKLIGATVDRAAHLVEAGKSVGGCILVDSATRSFAASAESEFEPGPGEPDCYKLIGREHDSRPH